MPMLKPDPTFYPSPRLAADAPPGKLAFVAGLNPPGGKNHDAMLVVEAIIIPIFTILYGISLFQPMLFFVVLLGTVGYAAVGTLLACMAAQTRTRDVLLPILLFPLTVPVIIAAVKATAGILFAVEWNELSPWINLLLVYDAIFIAVAMMVFEFLVEE